MQYPPAGQLKKNPPYIMHFFNLMGNRNKNSENKFTSRIQIKIESILIFSRPFNLTACAGAYDT
jgi:hypothetical protein